MAVKTITIDLEAYEILARHKRAGQSFSQVIKQRLGGRMTGRDLAQAVARTRISEQALDAIEARVRSRRSSRPVRPGYDACRHLLPRGSPAREPPSPARAGDGVLEPDSGRGTPSRRARGLRAACRGPSSTSGHRLSGSGCSACAPSCRSHNPDERFPPTYAGLLASQERKRQRIATMDLLIATAAVVDGAALVTRNPKDCLADHRPRGRCVLKGLGAAINRRRAFRQRRSGQRRRGAAADKS